MRGRARPAGPRLHARVRARRELAAGGRVRVLQPAGGEQRLRVALLHLHAADQERAQL